MKRKILIAISLVGIVASSLIWADKFDSYRNDPWDATMPVLDQLIQFFCILGFSILLYFQLRKPESSIKERLARLEEELEVLKEKI